ncbi:hypothetical protein ZEAMMB73_Zm00001d024992 [Zea mays]|uniref:Uncharacterized protein n=1 Tax=Zea mays TaxID=4577 RepID=A0A1D6J3C2_MAIZE|nr:hypothetical protein ZEAMMB73_Zm00001d024992 [Zea mays]
MRVRGESVLLLAFLRACPPLPFPSCSTKPCKWGRRGMGVPDLLSMVPVRWLDISCLHGLSLTTVSTRYASTTSIYLSPILLSLQKLLCCSSVVLGDLEIHANTTTRCSSLVFLALACIRSFLRPHWRNGLHSV